MLSIIILFSYIILYICKYGVPKSLSATYYDTKWFVPVMLVTTVLILPHLIEMSGVIGFAICLCLLFVTFTPNYREDELLDKVHTYSAVAVLVISQIWIVFVNTWILLAWIPLLIYYIIYKDKNLKFWAEVTMASTVYLALLL